MMNPITICITDQHNEDRNIFVTPILETVSNDGLLSAGIFKLYEYHFCNQANEVSNKPDVPENYLGQLSTGNKGHWHYEGNLLTINEQKQITAMIDDYQDWDI